MVFRWTTGCSKVSFCQSSSCHCKGPFRVCYHRRAGVYSYARAMEDMLRQLQSGLARSQPSAPAVVELQLNQAKESGWGDRTASPELPPGLDPGLARQALQSGISHAALGELAKIVGGGNHLPLARSSDSKASSPRSATFGFRGRGGRRG